MINDVPVKDSLELALIPANRSLLDHSGNGRTITQAGTGLKWVRRNGVDHLLAEGTGRLVVPNDAGLEAMTDFSVFGAVNAEDEPTTLRRFLYKRDVGGTHLDLGVQGGVFAINDGGAVTTAALSLNRISSFAITLNSGSIASMWGNGTYSGPFNGVNTITTDNADLTLLNSLGANPFLEPYRVLLLYSRVLEAWEVALLHEYTCSLQSPTIPQDRRYFDQHSSSVPDGPQPQYGPVGPELVQDGDMETVGPTVIADGDMEVVGATKIVDGDMEAAGVASWPAYVPGLITKSTVSPHGGTQALRIAYVANNNPGAYQDVLTLGKTYRARGWFRGDGTHAPWVYNGGVSLLGTSSTEWQRFDVTFTSAAITQLIFRLSGSAGWCEFDDITITDCADDTADWSVGSSALLSKQAGLPSGTGSQVLRVEYGGTSNPWTYQNILVVGHVYRVTGWARGDNGSAYPRIRDAAYFWNGTVSAVWQPIDVTFTCTDSVLRFYGATAGAGWVEFSDVVITDCAVDTADWTPTSAALLTKSASPHSGAQSLQVTYNAVAHPAGRQNLYSIGKRYRTSGWMAGDGSNAPRVGDSGSGVKVTGVANASWQYFDFVSEPSGNGLLLYGAQAAGYTRFDNVSVVQTNNVLSDGDMESRGPNKLLDGSMETVGPTVLVDGDMEEAGVDSWTAAASAVLSKSTENPYAGFQALRITDTGTTTPRASQAVLVAGNVYRLRGWARGDGGSSIPALYDHNLVALWAGTSSTSWQAFDVTFTQTGGATLYLRGNTSALGWVEFDSVTITDCAVDTADWTSGWGAATATLTKEAGTRTDGSGAQFLRVAYDADPNPTAYQTVLTPGNTYRAKGWARGDGGSGVPYVYLGGGAVWSGTTSTVWQYFDVTAIAAATQLIVRSAGSSNHADFDDLSITDVTEDTAEWGAGNSAELSKQGDAYEGDQCLRVEYDGVAQPYAYQANRLVMGKKYRITGRARSSGGHAVKVGDLSGGISWVGTTSTSWQAVDVVGVAANTHALLLSYGNSAGEFGEFDSILIREVFETAGAWDLGTVHHRTVADSSGHCRHGDLVGGCAPCNTEAGRALRFDGVTGSVEAGDPVFSGIATLESVCRIRSDVANAQIVGNLGGTFTGMSLYATVGGVYVLSGNGSGWVGTAVVPIDDGAWHHVVGVYTGTEIKIYMDGELRDSQATTINFPGVNLRIGRYHVFGTIDGDVKYVKAHNRILSLAEIKAGYNELAQRCMFDSALELIRPTTRPYMAGEMIPGTEYQVESGQFTVGEDTTTGAHYIECAVAGIISRRNQQAYGTWEFKVSHAPASETNIIFVATERGNTTTAGQDGYFINLSSTEIVKIREIVSGSASSKWTTSAGYIAAAVMYKIRVTRSLAGAFTAYIQGGSFTAWTLIAVVTGTNPFTDTTTTTSRYCVFDMDAGDRLYLDRQLLGCVPPV